MSCKSRVQRLEDYFSEVDVWSPKSAKRIVCSPKYAIFSANNDEPMPLVRPLPADQESAASR